MFDVGMGEEKVEEYLLLVTEETLSHLQAKQHNPNTFLRSDLHLSEVEGS